MTTTPQPGAWYISRDGYARHVRVTHVTPASVTVEWHDGWGKPRTADLTHRQIATTYRPLDPDVHAPTELGATSGTPNGTTGSVAASPLDLDAIRARHDHGDRPAVTAEVDPHPATHSPHTFICSTNSGCIVGLSERPADRIAAALLEDVGDWHKAVKGLTRTAVPPAVSDALDALHDAVCGWTDWTARQRTTAPPA